MVRAHGCRGSCCQPTANRVSIVELAPRHNISVLQVSKEKQKKACMAPLASPALPSVPAPGSEACERQGPPERLAGLRLPESSGEHVPGTPGAPSLPRRLFHLCARGGTASPCPRSPASSCSAGDTAGGSWAAAPHRQPCPTAGQRARAHRALPKQRSGCGVAGRSHLTRLKVVRNPTWNTCVLGVTPGTLGGVGEDTCRFSGDAHLPSAAGYAR